MSIPGPFIARIGSVAGGRWTGRAVRRLALVAMWAALAAMGYFGAMAWHASAGSTAPHQLSHPAR
jgi:hypothetical protein